MLGKNWLHSYNVHEALYINCEIHGPWVRGSGSRMGPVWPYSIYVFNLRKSSSLPHIYLLKLNAWLWCPYCEIHDPWVSGSGSRVGPIWPYSKNVLNLRKSSFLLPYKYIYISGYKVHEALYQNCEIYDPRVRGSGSRVGPIWPYSKMF